VAENNILILVEEKKISDSEFLSYNLMLDSGKKYKYSNSRVVRKKFFERNKKPLGSSNKCTQPLPVTLYLYA
jgi:hypothetical protein